MATYMQLLIPILMWSVVGPLVKVAARMADSGVITFSRFFFAALFLAGYLWVRDRRLPLLWRNPWIWAGVLAKSLNYISENIAIARGYSYGNIVIFPIQAVFIAFVSVAYLKEGLGLRRLAAIVLCVGGVLILSWNGVSVRDMLTSNAITMALFGLAGLGAAFHMLSQKVLVRTVDSGQMNFAIFFWCALLTAVPIPFAAAPIVGWDLGAFAALVALGLITGVSFLLYANALKTVPVVVAALAGNSSVLLTMVWSRLFFSEPLTVFTGAGAAIFLVGLAFIGPPTEGDGRSR